MSVAAVVALCLFAASPAGAHFGKTNTGAVLKRGVLEPDSMAIAAQRAAEPPITATPRAECEPGGIPEGPMQGRVAADAVAAGKVDKGYLCNLTVIGKSGSTGGFRVHRYVDRSGPRVRLLRHDAAVPDQRAQPERRADGSRRPGHDGSDPPGAHRQPADARHAGPRTSR